MTNKNNYNFFSVADPGINTQLAVGRYLCFYYSRNELPEQLKGAKACIQMYLNNHPRVARIFYRGTPLGIKQMHKVSSWDDRDLAHYIPTDLTGDVQLYSTSGSGLPITWAELFLYRHVGEYVAQCLIH